MTTMARIVVIGDLMTYTVAHATLPLARGSDTPSKVTTHGGGSGANVAAWAAADGADVAFIGRRGADIAGRNRDMELMGYGVDARLVMDPERSTGTCVVMVTHKGERTMLSDPGANAALSPDDLPHDLFVPGAHLHVSGYTLLSEGARAAGLAAIDYARRTNMTASVDAASAAPLERAGAEPFLELSSGAVLLFVNAAQAKVLTGREDAEQAARVLTAWYPHVAVKLGADGALFYANGRPPVGRSRPRPHRRAPGPVERSGGGEAAVHVQGLAGEVVAGARGQEHRDPREVRGLAVAAHHGPGRHRRRARRILGHDRVEPRRDEPRADRVAAHSGPGPRLGLRTRQRRQAALGRPVPAAVAEGPPGLLRGHVDDPPPSSRRHRRPEPLAEQERRGQVHRHGQVPFGQGQLRQRRTQVDARAVDQDVGLAEGLGGRPGRTLGGGTVAEIGTDPGRPAPLRTQRGDGIRQPPRVPRDQHHLRAGPRQRRSHPLADPRTAAGDHGHPVCQ